MDRKSILFEYFEFSIVSYLEKNRISVLSVYLSDNYCTRHWKQNNKTQS